MKRNNKKESEYINYKAEVAVDALNALAGKESVKKLMNEICLQKKQNVNFKMPVMNYIIQMPEGQGFSTLVDRIAAVFRANRLLEFRSKEMLIEYDFTDSQDNLEKLIYRIQQGTVISNRFYGIVGIDFRTIPVHFTEDNQYINLVKYMAENRENICFILRMNLDDPRMVNRFLGMFQSKINMTYLVVPPLDKMELISIMKSWLVIDGIQIEADVDEMLMKVLDLQQHRISYAGLKSIRKAIDALEFSSFVHGDNGMITECSVKRYLEEDLLVEIQRENEMNDSRRIGFV